MEEKDPYKITANSWNSVAKLYEGKFMELDLYNETYDRFLDRLKDSSNVLDMGCGPGNISSYVLKGNNTLNISGIDVSANMIELAKKNLPAGRFEVLDVRDVSKLGETYQGILCGFCIPYLSKPDVQKLLQDCYEILTPGGTLYLSFVEGTEDESGYITGASGDSMYFYYHEVSTIVGHLESAGFKIHDHTKVAYTLSSTSQVHEILFAVK